MRHWEIALSSADEAPVSAPILLKGDICSNLKAAQKLGYDAIEVHTRENVELNYDEILSAIKETGAKISMVVTGRLMTEGKCNLMDEAPFVEAAAVDGMKKYIDMASKLHADIVIGWVKGNVPAGKNRDKFMNRLAKNLKVLNDYGKGKNVKLNIEVINRYEVNVFTTAAETVSFIEEHKLDNCYVHLDTFHMNIDEEDPLEAIRMCKGKLGYFHLADNTRKYLGSGTLDFESIFQELDDVGYEGYLAVECLPYPNSETAAKKSIESINMTIAQASKKMAI